MPEKMLGKAFTLEVHSWTYLTCHPEYIQQQRRATIQELLSIPYDFLNRFLQGQNPVCKRRSASCDAVIFGSLIFKLHEIGLWPEMEVEAYTKTADNLAVLLETSLAKFLPNDYLNHKECGIDQEAVQRVMKAIPAADIESHRKHMEERKKLFDLSRNEQGG